MGHGKAQINKQIYNKCHMNNNLMNNKTWDNKPVMIDPIFQQDYSGHQKT